MMTLCRVLFPACLLVLIGILKMHGQTERFVSFPDQSLTLNVRDQVLDKEGNLIVLADLFRFYHDSVVRGAGPGFDQGSAICKTDPDGTLKWIQRYRTNIDEKYEAFDPDGTLRIPYEAVKSIFTDDSGNAVLPYCVYTTNDTFVMRYNAVLVADQQTGVIKRQIMFDDSCCPQYRMQAVNFHNNRLDYFYAKRSGYFSENHLYLESRDINGDSTTRQLFTVIDSPAVDIPNAYAYNFHHDEHVMYGASSGYLRTYSALGKVRLNVQLCDTGRQYLVLSKIASNNDFYAVSYALIEKESREYTEHLSVFDRSGRLIHDAATGLLRDMVIADDNTIWGLVHRDYTDAPEEEPIRINQMSLLGNPIRRLRLGCRGCHGARLSIFDGRELVVSGTTDYASPRYYPDNRPSEIYIYRRPIADIPLIDSSAADGCDHIRIAPNPAPESVVIDILRPGTKVLKLSIWNKLGQLKCSGDLYGSTQLSLADYSSGMYFLELVDPSNGSRCITKLEHR